MVLRISSTAKVGDCNAVVVLRISITAKVGHCNTVVMLCRVSLV